VSGNIEKIYVDIGTPVRKNQLLALIDTTELHQQAQQSAASIQNARLNYERNKKLLEQDLVATEDLDNAETVMKIAAANYETAMTRLDYACIKAPFAGFITKRFLDPGALVSPGNNVLFTLMDIGSVKVVINVLEKDTPLIPNLTKAIIVADALPNQQFEGHISRYGQAIDLSTRTMPVEITILNKDYTLKPGMFVTATINVNEHPDAITVPTQAVLKDDKGSYLFILEDAKAKRTPVELGAEQNSRLEILNGLTGTENVITTGQEFVKDGSSVTVQQ
jgi:RND family efflux transporter MFP subunit